MKENYLSLKDFLIPVIEIVLVVLGFVFSQDLINAITSGTAEALASIVLIPITIIIELLSVVFNIIGLIQAFKQNKHRIFKWIQIVLTIANTYLLYTTIIELI